ncbi:MAG: PhnD/SsuA/transferrin family substrate-binding protein [Deltaproteobacteria bacterium]|nr:PhnD/SsuA/transferrin family substrate-binding protein [Deltaproteobacteria bacterium]
MIQRLRFGVIPDSDQGYASADRFASALSALIGVPVEVHRAIDYRVLLASLEQGRIELAWVPPLAAARALRAGSVIEVAVTMRSGSSSYYTGLVSLKGGKIESLKDLDGVRAAWVDRESASGYLVIRAALREQGVSLVRAFSEEIFVRSHAEVARAVAEGRVDVGATCFNFVSGTVEIARSGFKDHGGVSDDTFQLLAHAGPIPSDIVAAHRAVPSKWLQLLQSALVDARPASVHEAAKDLVHADGFVRPTVEHRDMLTALLQMVDRPSSGSVLPPPMPVRR